IFFFQAEDGIRDFHVTGVQTCALPIFTQSFTQPFTQSPSRRRRRRFRADGARAAHLQGSVVSPPVQLSALSSQARLLQLASQARSEERRVGKECRCRWRWEHYEKKATR